MQFISNSIECLLESFIISKQKENSKYGNIFIGIYIFYRNISMWNEFIEPLEKKMSWNAALASTCTQFISFLLIIVWATERPYDIQ